jgi:hypothetical protein
MIGCALAKNVDELKNLASPHKGQRVLVVDEYEVYEYQGEEQGWEQVDEAVA